jgi:hypothetical protein
MGRTHGLCSGICLLSYIMERERQKFPVAALASLVVGVEVTGN